MVPSLTDTVERSGPDISDQAYAARRNSIPPILRACEVASRPLDENESILARPARAFPPPAHFHGVVVETEARNRCPAP